jgi:glutathione synthase/RimK-type ligase-like ATP-grasp enzyme
MDMIAIHNSGNWSYRKEWEEYCAKNKIPYKLINAYSTKIIEDLTDCKAFFFHHHHTSVKDYLFAKELLFSLEQSGKKVFPNFNTGWHFDDKLGQKYLLEAINAPMVETYVAYSLKEARDLVAQLNLPIVYKLRGGAGSNNVGLIKTKTELEKHIQKSFISGFEQYNRWNDIKDNFSRWKKGKASNFDLFKSFLRIFKSTEFSKLAGPEKGYVLLQKFIPNNDSDIRVVVIGKRAFAIKRMVRENDFRASGGGSIIYDKDLIPTACINIGFEVSEKLNAQCVAFDFVFEEGNNPLIVEINYGFAHRAYNDCPGWWTRDLQFIEGKIDPCGWMIEEVLRI